MSKILITGTRGYLGSALAAHLKNHELTLMHGRRDLPERWDGDFLIHSGFTVDFSYASRCAAESENFLYTQELLERTRGHVIFLSAAAALGVSQNHRTRNERDYGTSDPDFLDWMQTRYVQEKIACENLLPPRSTTLYLTTCYGPGMQKTVTDNLQRKICPPGGTSFLGLQDFLAAVSIILDKKIPGRFVVSSGNCTYQQLLSAATGGTVYTIPHWTKGFFGSPLARSAFGYKYYSPMAFIQASGWQPKMNLVQCLRSATKETLSGEI